MGLSRRSFLKAGAIGLVAVPAAATAPVALLSAISSPDSRATVAPSGTALDEIPPGYLQHYIAAAETICPALPWTVVAAIGSVESGHNPTAIGPPLNGGPGVARIPASSYGTSLHGDPVFERAVGMMQFLPSTWLHYAVSPPRASHRPDPFDPADAIYTAVRYLCDHGADRPDELRRGIYAYNRAAWYVEKVLDKAAEYAAAAEQAQTSPVAAGAGRIAPDYVEVALGQLGKPYRWGGTGPNAFDCSGLISWSLAQVDLSIPRTAATQASHVTAHGLSTSIDVAAATYGALVWRVRAPVNPGGINHIAISLGDGRTVEAWRTGEPVQIKQIARRTWTGAGLIPGVAYG